MEEKQQSFFAKASQWVKNSVTLKLISIGILILLMLIPLGMVEDLIWERKNRKRQAVSEISEKWGNSQTVKGPVLSVPYKSYQKVKQPNDQYVLTKVTKYAHILPAKLDISCDLDPKIRYRGIYKVPVYASKIKLTGVFKVPELAELDLGSEPILDQVFLGMGLSDLRSVQEEINIKLNGVSMEFEPGIPTDDIVKSGVAVHGVELLDSSSTEIPFSIELQFNGSEGIYFVPLGKVTTTSINSTWKDPSFTGAFLPDERNITEAGFEAKWKVLHLNRNYPQIIKGANNQIDKSSYGVDLFLTVDEYKKNERSAKYAILFIALTFVVFFFIQIMNKVRIHPIQYIMVGLALTLFYTLLLALSEKLGFASSYVLATCSIVGLITFYVKGIIGAWKIPGFLGGLLLVLYGYIYSLIQLRDYALLMGSIGLFVILATVMYLSRKIDWYNISSGNT